MALFEIKVYERHLATYEVFAPSAAEAVKKFMDYGNGEGICQGDALQYLDLDESSGISCNDPDIDPALPEQLRALDPNLLSKDGSWIPGLSRIRMKGRCVGEAVS